MNGSIRTVLKKLLEPSRIKRAACSAFVMVSVWPLENPHGFRPSTDTMALYPPSSRTVMVWAAEVTTGLCCSEWAQMGVSTMHSTSGQTSGPPADRE